MSLLYTSTTSLIKTLLCTLATAPLVNKHQPGNYCRRDRQVIDKPLLIIGLLQKSGEAGSNSTAILSDVRLVGNLTNRGFLLIKTALGYHRHEASFCDERRRREREEV